MIQQNYLLLTVTPITCGWEKEMVLCDVAKRKGSAYSEIHFPGFDSKEFNFLCRERALASLNLCKQNLGNVSNHRSQLWFNVLDRFINAKGFFRCCDYMVVGKNETDMTGSMTGNTRTNEINKTHIFFYIACFGNCIQKCYLNYHYFFFIYF